MTHSWDSGCSVRNYGDPCLEDKFAVLVRIFSDNDDLRISFHVGISLFFIFWRGDGYHFSSKGFFPEDREGLKASREGFIFRLAGDTTLPSSFLLKS